VKDFKPTDPVITTTKEMELAGAIATTVINAPTIAYHIKNAILFNGSFYVGPLKHPIADKSLFDSDRQELCYLKTGALASTFLGTKYFGHWLADDCTKYLLAEEIGPPLCLRGPAFGHREKYQAYFGQDWTPTDRARIDHLVIFQDFSQNSSKRKRYTALRNQIKKRFPSNAASRTCVYLKRGHQLGVRRVIQNEDEIINALAKRNFLVVDVETDSLECIVGALVNAKIVVSMEGSHITHCTFTSPENSGLIVLQPADRFSAVHRGWCECLGVTFGFVVGVRCEGKYHFSPREILLTFDMMLDRIET
jgi:hypothetical protein